jgi:hypothetical protein
MRINVVPWFHPPLGRGDIIVYIVNKARQFSIFIIQPVPQILERRQQDDNETPFVRTEGIIKERS